MNKEQALQLILQVTQQFRGTRQEHASLQEAEKVLIELMKPKESDKK